MTVPDKAYALAEEFTDFILVDEQRGSIVMNLDKEYFSIIFQELKRLNFELIHSSSFKGSKTLTCVFKLISCKA